MPKPESIRERFRNHVGDERYRDFVYDVPDSTDGTRLRYWQEREWERFVAQHPDCELDFAGILDVFAGCPEFGAHLRKENYRKQVATWICGRPLSVDNLEKQAPAVSKGRTPLREFGFGSVQWQKIKSQMQPGDELYRFRSPPETWANLRGRAGIVLVRDGKVIEMLVTSLN